MFETFSKAKEISAYATQLAALPESDRDAFVQSNADKIAALKADTRKALTGCSPRSFNLAWSADYKDLFVVGGGAARCSEPYITLE